MRLTSSIVLAIIVASLGSVIEANSTTSSGCLSQTRRLFSNSISFFFFSIALSLPIAASEAKCSRVQSTQPDRLVSSTPTASTSTASNSTAPTSTHSTSTHSTSTHSTSTTSHTTTESSNTQSNTSSAPTSIGVVVASTSGTGAAIITVSGSLPVSGSLSASGNLSASASSGATRADITWVLGIFGVGLGIVMLV
jgi:hypothetical protein